MSDEDGRFVAASANVGSTELWRDALNRAHWALALLVSALVAAVAVACESGGAELDGVNTVCVEMDESYESRSAPHPVTDDNTGAGAAPIVSAAMAGLGLTVVDSGCDAEVEVTLTGEYKCPLYKNGGPNGCCTGAEVRGDVRVSAGGGTSTARFHAEVVPPGTIVRCPRLGFLDQMDHPVRVGIFEGLIEIWGVDRVAELAEALDFLGRDNRFHTAVRTALDDLERAGRISGSNHTAAHQALDAFEESLTSDN